MDKPGTTGDVIRGHAADRPDTAAILAPGRAPLSYAALSSFLDEIRDSLNGWGIGCGDRVALAIIPRPEMAVAHVAVSNCAASAPLDPKATPAEFEDALLSLKATAVIVSDEVNSALRDCASRLGIQCLTLFPRLEEAAGLFSLSGGMPAASERPGTMTPDDITLVMRTSGTTSKPKIVPISHRLAVTRGQIEADAFKLDHTDRCLNFRPLHVHSALNAGMIVPLSAGGGVILPDDFDAEKFFDQLETYAATWFLGSPAYHDAILEQVRQQPDKSRRHSLRFVRSSSYRLAPEQMAELEALFGVPFLERLGGTEPGIIARNPPPPEIRKPGTVGTPVDSEIALLGAGKGLIDPRKAGEIGEIAVRGEGVFSGYEDNPEANDTAFVDGWFRTGDLGKWDEDGYLTVCGRVKEVINRGGQKVSPVEVEDLLGRHPRIADVACFAIPHPTLGEEVAAAIVLADGPEADTPLDAGAVSEFLSPDLAAFKIPKRVVCCGALPRGPTGKLHRLSLASDLGLDAIEGETSPKTQMTDTSGGKWAAEITDIWLDVLKRETVGANDNFFQLGGESLMAARVLARIGTVTGVNLPLECIFGEGATIAGLAALIEAARNGETIGSASASGPITRREPGSITPLSFSQERLRFLSELDPNDHIYNMQGAVRLTGSLKPDVLRRVLNEIVARHEILRTRYPIIDGTIRQVVEPHMTLDMPVIDLTDTALAHREDEVQRIAREDARQRYDLSRGPLIRAKLIKCADDDHVLLLPKHHMIFDGQSGGILYRELATLYGAFCRDEASPLGDLPIQFGDYAAWQRDRLSGPRLKEELSYWLEHLDDAPPLLDLPTDRPRPETQSYTGGRCWFSLSADLTGAIDAVSRQLGVTPFITLLAGFELLLYRYSGQDDFVLGTAVGGRTRPETDDLLGLFVNTLALRAGFDGIATVAEHIARVRQVAIGAYAHQEMPFDRLVEALHPDRSAPYAPVVQVLFGLMPKDLRRVELDDLTFERMNIDLGTARFDLSVMIGEDHGTLEGFFEYSADLFDQATVERMIGHFEVLLGSMISDTGALIGDVNMVPREERLQILGDWSGAAVGTQPTQSIHQSFEDWASKTPDATAITTQRQSFSYAAVNSWADSIAAQLRANGATAGQIIGISAERCPGLIAGLLGILKAGCAYMPIDLTLPRARFDHLIQDAGITIMLVHVGTANSSDRFHGLALQTIAIPTETSQIEPPRYEPETIPATPAYVMYTSGSTGDPKGVVVPHAAVMRLVRDTSYADFGPDEVFLQLAPASFDASTFEIWGCLLNGGRLVLMPPAQPSLGDIASTILDEGVTTAWFTAGLFHQMVDHEIACFADVRQVLAGGDILSPRHVAEFVKANPSCRLINGYGPTENTTFTCTHLVDGGYDGTSPVPIGRPVAGTSVYILDDNGNPVPAGVAGELHTGGLGLALGYLNDPEQNAARFIANPFDSKRGARLYRTGDRARYRQDGHIEFLGRLDDQLKILGYRVEPREIEQALLSNEGVEQAAVVARPDGNGDKALTAYVALGSAAPDTQTQIKLRHFLSQRLPPYMIPTDIVAVADLPLDRHGKVDRHALSRRLEPQAADSNPGRPPGTPMEKIIARLWCAELGLDQVSIDDNFFDLGGHSLSAMRLCHHIASEINIDFPLTQFFAAPTISSFAAAIDRASDTIERMRLVTIQSGGSAPPILALPGGGGSVVAYGLLSRRLGREQPFYGLEHPGLEGEEIPSDKIETVAQSYLEEIRDLHPDHPCILVGACSGAVVAFELARRLEKAGRRVDRVVMIDPSNVGNRRQNKSSSTFWRRLLVARFIVQRLKTYVRDLYHPETGTRREVLLDKLQLAREIVRRRDLWRESARELNQKRVHEATVSALQGYSPQPYDGAVTLIMGDRFTFTSEGKDMAQWQALCTGPFDLVRISGGTTGEMLSDPIVEDLVRELKTVVSRAA